MDDNTLCHFFFVVHILPVKPEQLQKLVLVTGVVGDLTQVFGGDGGPDGLAQGLHVVAQFPVVKAQAAFVGWRVDRGGCQNHGRQRRLQG